ncbi:unnamed protein product [Ilex paraguariensis]|uniref:Uncharacterized protein n=1 Tax=Ilex paraguariensis TaxID=185542 RepID=A0ABC8S1L5_9AQUA
MYHHRSILRQIDRHMCLALTCGPFFFVLFTLLTMADFPPNLEDGEKWLPSDIYQEIIYVKVEHEAHDATVTGESAAANVLNVQSKAAFENSARGFCSANLKRAGVLGNVCNIGHSQSHAFQATYGPVSPYNRTAAPQTQGNDTWPARSHWKEVKNSVGSSGGTGVYLPRATITTKEFEHLRSAGVFLQHTAADAPKNTFQKKQKGGKEQVTAKKFVVKKEAAGKKELPPVPAELALPKEWTY